MKHLKRLLPIMAAVLVSIQTVGMPVFAYHQQQDSVARTIITAGAIGAGTGAVTSIITGRGSVLQGAAVGAVIGAGSGAIYRAVRYNGNNNHGGGGYYRQNNNHYNQGYRRNNHGYGHQGYNRGHDANYNNYPNHQYSHYDNDNRGDEGSRGYAYNGGGGRGCPNGGGGRDYRVHSNW